MSLKTLTFEGTEPTGIYDMTVAINPSSIVLVNAVVDTVASAGHRSIYLEIGNTINSNNVIDNDDKNNYLKLPLYENVVGVDNVSQYNPNIGYKTGGELHRQTKFTIRDSNGDVMSSSDLNYFCFQFQVYA